MECNPERPQGKGDLTQWYHHFLDQVRAWPPYKRQQGEGSARRSNRKEEGGKRRGQRRPDEANTRPIAGGLGNGYTANGESSSEPVDIVDSALHKQKAEIFGEVKRGEGGRGTKL